MTTSTRFSQTETLNPTRLEAVPTAPVELDRDRAIDAWIAEIYQAAIQPRGWREFLVSLAEALRLDPTAVVAIAEDGHELRHLSGREGPERSALARLSPNLHAARALRERLVQLTLERDAGVQLLDRLPVGVVIVDSCARIVKCNRAADDILALGDGIRRHDGLEACNATDNAALRNAISAAAAETAIYPRQERLKLPRASGSRPWCLEISRIEHEAGRPAAMIVIGDGEPATRPALEALRTYYGLTPAEAELTMLLASGHSLERAAERRTVSRNTARGQLKRIFVKTGTNRQAELVRLVLSGPMGLRSDD